MPSEKHMGVDYLPKSYVDWVQAAGGRVMPIPSGVKWNTSTVDWKVEQSNVWSEEQYTERFQLMNGLLLPGGNPWPQVSSNSVRMLLEKARAAAVVGDYFPVWGTCAGFETLMVLSSASCQTNVTDGQIPADSCTGPMTYGWNSTNQSLPQSLREAASTSRLLGSMEPVLLKAMQEQPVSANFHHAAMTPENFEKQQELSKTFRILATSTDDATGREFASTVEGIDLPWYGTQWHPEKPAGEWGIKNGLPYEAINHSPEAIRLGQHMANVLISEASRSSHGKGQLETINPMLIINHIPRAYNPKHPLYMQTYSFDWTASGFKSNARAEAVVV